MTVQPDTQPSDAPEVPESTTAQEPTAVAPAKPEPPKASSPWDDPKAAQAEIERLRRENASSRTNAKQQAADEARTALAQQIGKALGIVKDDTPPDPAELTKQIEQHQADAKNARVELAVFKHASAVGGDPHALLDSASFLAKARDLDPSDSAALEAAIKSAVEANPRLAAAPVSRPPAPNPAQGASASGPGVPDDEYARFYPPTPNRKAL